MVAKDPMTQVIDALKADVQAQNKQHVHAFAELCRLRIPVAQMLVVDAMGVAVNRDTMRDIVTICETLDRASQYKEA